MDRRNHVYQAVDLLKRTYNIHKGIKIYIEKRIPVATGLAGVAVTVPQITRLEQTVESGVDDGRTL